MQFETGKGLRQFETVKGFKKIRILGLMGLMILMMFALDPAAAFAADGKAARIGDAEYYTLQEAVEAAASGDEIIVLRDISGEEIDIHAKSLTIDFDGHTLDGKGVDRFLLDVRGTSKGSAEATIKNATISGFDGGYHMIRLYIASSKGMRLTMENCTIRDNRVQDNLDAIVFLNSWNQTGRETNYLTFNNCVISNNVSESGNIIRMNEGRYVYTVLELNDTLVSDNTSIDGAISTSNYTWLKMSGSAIKNNTAAGRDNYDNSTGGVILHGYKCTMENSAIYGNVLENTPSAAPGTANDMWIWKNTQSNRDLSGMLAAKDMVDPFDENADFSNMVWKDGKATGYDEKLPKNVTADSYYTVMDASSLQVSQINDDPDKIYESLEVAFAAAEAGDRIKLISREQVVDVKTPITVDKKIILDVCDHDINFKPDEGVDPLFRVTDNGDLTLLNTQSDDPANKIDGGIASGKLVIEEGAKATIADAMTTDGIINKGELVLDAVQKNVDVTLGKDKVVKLGDPYDDVDPSKTKINIKLAEDVLKALNDGTAEVVRVVDGGSEDLLNSVAIGGIKNGKVLKEFKNDGIELKTIKAIYLKSAGDDSNSGADPDNAVKTFRHAKELLEADDDIEAIIICGVVNIKDEQTWTLPKGKSVIRDTNYTEALARVKEGGKLTLNDITINGRKIDARDALIYVEKGGKLVVEDGAVLKDNRNARNDFYRFGGGVCSYGDVEMTGGKIDGCFAAYGGGIFQCGGTLFMTGGRISNNEARPHAVAPGDYAESAGGGVFLGGLVEMTFGSEEDSSDGIEPEIVKNYSRGEGGGIALGATRYLYGWFAKDPEGGEEKVAAKLNMYGGLIDGNTAVTTGGGIFVQDSNEAYVYGGRITNNTARGLAPINYYRFAGGGIYVNGLHTVDGGKYLNGSSSELYEYEKDLKHGFLYIESAEIASNTANWLGGALAVCNVSKTIVGDYATNIHDNVINNESPDGNMRIKGQNVDVDVYLSSVGHYNTNVPSNHPPAYLSNLMIDGSDYEWHTPNGQPLTKEQLYFNERSLAAATDAPAASAKAKVLISGNYGGTNGGGLGSNGIIVIGSILPKVDVSVKKEWGEDTESVAKPTKLRYILYRAEGSAGQKEKIDVQEVEAGEAGDYAYTWKDLLKNVPGTENEYVYTVEEDLTYEAVDAEGNAVDLVKLFESSVRRKEDSAREISRPHPDGTVKTYDQVVKNYKIINERTPHEVPIKITKKALGGDELEGARITVVGMGDLKFAETWVSTDKPHELMLMPGEYTMMEVIAPVGYERIEEAVRFSVDKKGNVTVLGGDVQKNHGVVRTTPLEEGGNGLILEDAPLPKVVKTVNSENNLKIENINQIFQYAIKTDVPYTPNQYFAIVDNVPEVLEIVDADSEHIRIHVKGKNIDRDLTSEEVGSMLNIKGNSLTIESKPEQFRDWGAFEMEVVFSARFRSGADLGPYVDKGVENVANAYVDAMSFITPNGKNTARVMPAEEEPGKLVADSGEEQSAVADASEEPDKQVEEVQDESGKSSGTGDSSRPIMALIIMSAAVAAAAVLRRRKA